MAFSVQLTQCYRYPLLKQNCYPSSKQVMSQILNLDLSHKTISHGPFHRGTDRPNQLAPKDFWAQLTLLGVGSSVSILRKFLLLDRYACKNYTGITVVNAWSRLTRECGIRILRWSSNHLVRYSSHVMPRWKAIGKLEPYKESN